MAKYKLIIMIVVVVGGVLLLLTPILPRINHGSKTSDVATISSETPTPTVEPKQTSKPIVNNSQSEKPASCKVEGGINFLTATISQSLGAKLSYTGIDNKSRQIMWHVSPADDLKVGPNLLSQLKIPDDSSMVTVTLPASPVSKNYTLTASMTSGKMLANGGIKVYEFNCTGSINVTLNY